MKTANFQIRLTPHNSDNSHIWVEGGVFITRESATFQKKQIAKIKIDGSKKPFYKKIEIV